MEKELISIIVPVYNTEKYLRKCIESIINQTYKNIELILVNDGSTDNSGNICDEYAKTDSRIKVIHKENGGVSSARNTGLESAKGEWLVFVDGDDYISSDYCTVMLEKAKKNDAELVLCGYKRVYENKEELINCQEEKQFNKREFLMKVLNVQNSMGFCHMKLISKKTIKNVRLNEKLSIAEDALFSMQLSQNINKAIFVPKPLYNYRFNNNSAVRKFDKEFVNKILLSMKEAKDYLISEFSEDEEIIQGYYNYVVYHLLLISVNYCYNSKNNLTNKEKKKMLKKVCEMKEFAEAIKKSNYNGLSITRKITLYTIKHKLYFLTGVICLFRQHQFKN